MSSLRPQVPVVTQLFQTECGPAVVSALLRYYGRFEDIREVRSNLEPGRDGVSLREMAGALRDRGMETRLLTVSSFRELAAFNCPVVVLWEGIHFVILESYDGVAAQIMDPAVGRRRVVADELEKKAGLSVLWAAPGIHFEKQKRPLLRQWRNLPVERSWLVRRLAPIVALAALQFWAVLLVPQGIRVLIDNPQRWGESILATYALVAGLAVGFFGLLMLSARVTAWFISDMGEVLTTNVLTRLLRLPYRFFSSRETGELLYRIGTVDAVRDALAGGVANAITGTGVIVAVSIFLLTLPYALAAVILPLLLVNLIVTFVGVKRLSYLVDEELAKGTKESTLRLDALTSVASIRIGGYEEKLLKRWSQNFSETLEVTRRRIVLDEGVVTGFSTVVSLASPAVIALVLAQALLSRMITAGELVAVLALTGSLFQTVPEFSRACAVLGQASRYLSRLDEITETDPEPSGGDRLNFDTASLEFRDVSFAFDADSPILNGVSFTVKQGTTVAIVGESGSGKTTIAAIAATLFPPCSGEVLIGSIPTAEFDLKELRKSIGYVPQDNKLMNGSILDNLGLGAPIEEAEAKDICERVGLGDMIAALPMSLHTPVSDMGSNFSGGQRQRLALARTLLQKPRIMILDEATASLDLQSERSIVEYLASLGITQLVVAHRLESIRHADEIIVLQGGQILERGSFEALSLPGSYFDMANDLSKA